MKSGIVAFGLTIFLGGAQQDPDKAIAEFRIMYRKDSKALRALAVTALAKTPHRKTLIILAPLLTSDVKEVRVAAAKGLGTFTDWKRRTTPILLAGLRGPNVKEIDVQVAIFQALGQLKDLNSLETIHRTFENKYEKVARAAISAAGDIRHITSLDMLYGLMYKTETWISKKQSGGYRDDKGQQGNAAAKKKRVVGVQKAVIASIQKITKEKWTTTIEWKVWFSRRRAKFTVPE